MTALFCVLTAVIGVILGGFIGRAARALPRGNFREILVPRCPSCGRELSAKFSLPIIGFFISRTKCPHCGERRGAQTLVSEAVFGALSALLYLKFAFSYLFFIYWVAVGTLLLLSLIDLDIQEAPHGLLLVILLLGALNFVFSFFDFSLMGTVWWEHLVGAFVISLPLFILLMVTGGVGGGDVKLMFVLGLLLGYKLILVAFLFGIVAAAIVAVALHFVCGKSGKYPVPLIPFLAGGAALAILCGEYLLDAMF